MHVWVMDYTGGSQLSTNCIKCKVLCLGKHNLGVQHRLKFTCLGSSSVERGLGNLLDKINMSVQCPPAAKKAIDMLGWINNSITNRNKEIIILLYSALSWPQLEQSIHFWFLQHITDVDRLERIQRNPQRWPKDQEAWGIKMAERAE